MKTTNEALRESEAQKAFLLKLSDTIRPLADARAVEQHVTQAAMEYFNTNRCYYCEIINDDAIIRTDARCEGFPSVAGTYPLSSFTLFKQVVDAGETFVVHDVHTADYVDADLKALCVQLQIISFIDVPVIKDGNAVGILCLVQNKPRQWRQTELELAEEIAERAWAAVERAQTEKALRESEERLRNFITASSSTVYRMNANWQEMYSLVGNNFLKDTTQPDSNWINRYILPEDKPTVLAAINRAIDEKTMFEFEHRVITANGDIGWVHSRAVPVLDESGSIKEWIGTGSDITTRKQAEMQLQTFNARLEKQISDRTAELQESKKLLQATFDSALEMIQVFSAVRDETGRITDFTWVFNNHASELRYGHVIGKSLLKNNPGVVEEGIFDRFIEVVETGIPCRDERHYVHEQFNGWFYQSVVKLGDGVATNTADITERKEAEYRLRNLEKRQQQEILRNTLLTQEKERRRIAENLHNGLGQLLYGVRMSLTHLTPQQAAGKPEEFRKDKTYTDKLLSQAITETRRLSHELTPAVLEEFGLPAAIDDVCKQFQSALNVHCNVKLPDVELDRHMQLTIFRTVQELFTNVLKHANASAIELLIKHQDHVISILVSDNGKGINQKRNDGIGLTSIRTKVELLNGSLTIDSTAAQGTSVIVLIPF